MASPTVVAMDTNTGLTDVERQILDLERSWWKYPAAKETRVRKDFDMSSTRYYQVLNALIDRPEALAYDPMLVRRLIRLRTARAQQRSARRLGFDQDPRPHLAVVPDT